MDPENEDLKKGQKQDDQDIGSILKRGKDLFKKKTNQFVMLLRKIPAFIASLPIIIQLFFVIGVAAILTTFISTVLSIFGDNDTANAAAMTVIKNEVTLTKADDDNGYYFKINQNVLDVYIEETYKADQKGNTDIFPDDEDEEEEDNENNQEVPEEPDEDEEEKEIDEYDEEEEERTKQSIEDWFKVKDFKDYFVKMIRAEIASTYPKLGDYVGKEGSEDKQGNKKDNDGDYVAQGIVQIHRQKMNEDGSLEPEQELTYLPRESEDPNEKTLKSLIAANDPEALDHFSFDENSGQIYYATYRRVVVTVDGVEDPERSSYRIVENPPVSYTNLTAMCSMPYDFVFALLQTSKNPEYVMKVVDLLLDKSTLILMIQDQLNITEYTEVNRQVEKTEKTQLTGHEETYRYGNTVQTNRYWSHGATVATYSFPAGDTETVVSTTYENTANIYIKKAETWCMDFEQEAILNPPVETEGEIVEVTHDESEYAGLTYPDTPIESNRDSIPSPSSGATFTIIEKFLSNEKLVHTSKVDSTSYTWTISALTPKRINYERFVGLWKNDKGEWYEGCLFDENNPNQKDVSYPVPEDERKLDVVVDNIADHQGQTINDLTELLSLHQNTQTHEELMKYFWNKYYGEEIYEVDLDKLLNLFNTDTFTSILGGSIYGNSVEEKVWFALIDAGFSEYAAAGAMGNIWRESSFLTNNLQNSYENEFGMNDAEYTTKVDDGSYTNFATDKAGYGLCQWTTSGRKQGLLSYTKGKNVSISDANSQIEYLLAELGIQNSASSFATYNLLSYHGCNGDDWINADSVEKATEAFCWSFERPGESSAALSLRIAQAKKYYEEFHGKNRPDYNVDTVIVGSYAFPHYLQRNYSGSYGTSTISVSGCGPTSLAMILSGLLRDNTIDPMSVVNNIKANWPDGSYYVKGSGSSHRIFSNDFLFKYYGVTSQCYPSQAQALKALEEGYPVLGGEDRTFLSTFTSIRGFKSTGI